MRGDFSRLRFDPGQNYTAVLQQQGRVQLDSDGNEQRAIDEYLRRTETRDIVGSDGAPLHQAGFAISVTVDGRSLSIGAGRYYVEGLLCETAQIVDYTRQPYLIAAQPDIAVLLRELATGRSRALEVWLEAWQRLVTPIDDPCLREPALGEADTTVRVQTVWRVIAESVPIPAALGDAARDGEAFRILDCCTLMRLHLPVVETPGRLSAQTSPNPSQGSCLPSPNASYRGLENQLYRVEIHQGGLASQATFKWSRENASVVTRITQVSGSTVTVEGLGPDANLGFAAQQWVEITDDSDEFGAAPNQPGTLAQIKFVDAAHRQITLYQTAPAVDTDRGHAKLRRWDQTSTLATVSGLPCPTTAPVELENGIEVLFSADGTYAPGDHWLIPARTATGDIEWPPCGGDGAAFQPPHRIEIRRAPIACIHFDREKRAFVTESCRRLFPPLTELVPPSVADALHITGVSWANDDVMTLDQLLFKGLSVTFDQPPAMPVDARNFLVSLEVLLPAEQSERAFASIGTASLGAARSPVIIDGATNLSGTTVAWVVPRTIWLYLDQVLNGALRLAAENLFARARVVLKSRAVMQGSGTSAIYLDGQSFGTPGVRADQVTPRIDLRFPTGNQDRASDFESWFYVAPILLFNTFTIVPASVAVVRDPASGVTKVVDNSNNQPNPSGPAVTPTGTIVLNYPVLGDTVVALSLVNSAVQNVVRVPASVTVAKGSAQQTFPIQIVGNPGAVATKFDITATIVAPSGFQATSTAELTVTGFAQVILTGTTLNPTLLAQGLNVIADGPNKAKP